jgi:hypothetical protein
MGFDYINPGINPEEVQAAVTGSAKGPKTVAPAGTYEMELRSIRGRKYRGDKVLAEIYARHADQENFGFTGATLTLFRLKEDPSKSTSQRALLEIGKALSLDEEELCNVNWAVDTSADAGDFGELPAALMTGPDNILSLEGLRVKAIVDVEEFPRRDGTKGSKNVIKAIYALD